MYLISGIVVSHCLCVLYELWTISDRMMVHLWMWYHTVYECYMRHGPCLTGVNHLIYQWMISNYTPDMLSCYPGSRSLEPEPCTLSVLQWSKDDDICMYMLSHCFMSVVWCMDYVWQEWITPQTTPWLPTTPLTCSAITLIYRQKFLHNVTHQWCSGPRKMVLLWISYPTFLWVLHELWTTSDWGGSPNRPQHDVQLYQRHAQLLPWLAERRAWTMYISSCVVVQRWWYMYGYAILLVYECCMMHGPHLTWVDHI